MFNIATYDNAKSSTIRHTSRHYICPICLHHVTTISFDNKHGIDPSDQVIVNMLVNAHINIKHHDNTIVMIIKDNHTLISDKENKFM